MKVLLIQPPFEDFFTTSIRLYPLGLLYVAKIFANAGCEVQLLDCLNPLKKRQLPIPKSFSYLAPQTKNPYFFKAYYRFGISEEEIKFRIKEFSPDIIGISAQFTAYYQSVEELACLIKKNFHIPVFVGGNHATAFPKEIRQKTPFLDYVLQGPAEECLPRFLSSLNLQGREEQIDWRDIQPAHYLLEGNAYKIGRKNSISLISSRGCPYRCEFCSVYKMFGRKIAYRVTSSLIEEMRGNYIRKGARIFNFEDDNLSFNKKKFLEILEAIAFDPVLKDIEITAMNGICHSTLDEELLLLMRRTGFKQLNFSFITKSSVLQEKYNRPKQSPDFEHLIRAAKKLGFFITVYVILGLPGQSFQEAKDSIDYLLSLGVLVGPSVFYLPPGTKLYNRIFLAPEIRNNWNLYRSSAFAIETGELTRSQLLELFIYARKKNLENKHKTGGFVQKNQEIQKG